MRSYHTADEARELMLSLETPCLPVVDSAGRLVEAANIREVTLFPRDLHRLAP